MASDLCEHGFFRPWLQRGLCTKCEAECTCADMLIATGGSRWWCPAHHDFTSPPKYALEAVRRLNEKVLALSNWKYEREKADAAAGVKEGGNGAA